MVHILKKLQEGEGISLDEFRALKYKEREFYLMKFSISVFMKRTIQLHLLAEIP